MKKIFKKQQKLLEVLFIFIISLTPLLWLRDGSVIIGHDTGFYLNPVDRWKTYLYSWMPQYSFGVDFSLFRGFLITLAPHGLFGFLTGSLAWAQRFTFIFWFFVMGIPMYTFANYLLPTKKDWPFRLIASTYYVYNFFILQAWFIAERAKFSLYAALPLLLLVLFKTQRKQLGVARGAIYFGLILFFLNGGGSPPLYGFIILALLAYFVFYLFKSLLNKDFAIILRTVKMYVLFGISSLFLNFYWVYPLFRYYLSAFGSELASRGGVDGQIEWLIETSRHTSWFNLVRLQGVPAWYDNPQHPYSHWYLDNPFSQAISLIIPLVILFGFVFFGIAPRIKRLPGGLFFKFKKRGNSVILFVSLLFFVSLVASAGAHAPFGKFYVFLMKYVPGFAIFRNAFYKFASGLWFSAILLFAYFINRFICGRRLKNIFAGLVIAGILAFHFPYFNSNLFDLDKRFSTHLRVPDYVWEMEKYFKNNVPDEERILILPPVDPVSKVDAYRWGYYSLDNLVKNTFSGSVISGVERITDDLYIAFKQGNKAKVETYLQIFGIDKLLWRGDAVLADEYNIKLNEFDFVSLEKQAGEWQLYDLEFSSPQVDLGGEMVATNANLGFLVDNFQYQQNQVYFAPGEEYLGSSVLLRPDCFGCDFDYGTKSEQQMFLPKLDSEPSGKIESLVRSFLQQLRLKNTKIPSAKIDNLLSLLSEKTVRQAAKELDTEEEQELIAQYQQYMDELNSNFQMLSLKQKYFYSLRISDYLQAHQGFIAQHDPQSLLIDYIKQEELLYSDWIWQGQSYEEVRMLLDVPYSLEYRIEGLREGEQIKIDTVNVNSPSLFLEKGLHKLQINRQRPPSLLQSPTEKVRAQSKLTVLAQGVDLSGEEAYLLTFRYKFEKEGEGEPILRIESPEGFEEKILFKDGKTHNFSFLFSLEGETDFVVYTKQPEGLLKFEVEDLYLSRFEPLLLYFYHHQDKQDMTKQVVDYQKISPVSYRVRVKADNPPFLLILNEAYSPGWQFLDPDARHVKVNDFANGWIINRPLDGEYEIYYQSQDYYKLGQTVSILSLTFFAVFLVLLRYWKRRSGA